MGVFLYISNHNVVLWAGCSWYTAISYGLILLLGLAMVSKVKVRRI